MGREGAGTWPLASVHLGVGVKGAVSWVTPISGARQAPDPMASSRCLRNTRVAALQLAVPQPVLPWEHPQLGGEASSRGPPVWGSQCEETAFTLDAVRVFTRSNLLRLVSNLMNCFGWWGGEVPFSHAAAKGPQNI